MVSWIAVLVCGSVAAAQTEAVRGLDWRDFKSEDGGFSIKFPGSPKVDKSDLHLGPVALTRHTHSLLIGDMSFDIDYMDLAPGSDPDAAMEGGVSGLIRSMTARGARSTNAAMPDPPNQRRSTFPQLWQPHLHELGDFSSKALELLQYSPR